MKLLPDTNAYVGFKRNIAKLVEVSDRYSRIAVQLKRKGTPIPSNDIWIAAQTMEHGAELITSDRHFK